MTAAGRSQEISPSSPVEPEQSVAPGTVGVQKEAGHEVLAVVTGSGILLVDRLQLEGKNGVSAEEFLRGYPQIVGDVLG